MCVWLAAPLWSLFIQGPRANSEVNFTQSFHSVIILTHFIPPLLMQMPAILGSDRHIYTDNESDTPLMNFKNGCKKEKAVLDGVTAVKGSCGIPTLPFLNICLSVCLFTMFAGRFIMFIYSCMIGSMCGCGCVPCCHTEPSMHWNP